jgi:protein-disulfide isomerase
MLAKISTGTNIPAFGPADAKVTIVEFSDFQCPFCSRAATAVHTVKEKYSDKVRFVFRQFPLSFHQNAHLSAEAALAANAQGKFWEFHDKAFANQQKLDRASLEGYAKDIGLNVAEFKKALDDKTYAPTVDAELKLGEEVAVDGTPTMFLNGKRVSNPSDTTELSKEIDEALKGKS